MLEEIPAQPPTPHNQGLSLKCDDLLHAETHQKRDAGGMRQPRGLRAFAWQYDWDPATIYWDRHAQINTSMKTVHERQIYVH